MAWTNKRSGWVGGLVAVAGAVCALAASVRDNAPPGKLQEGAEAVCEVCQQVGLLLPDGGVPQPAEPGRTVGLVREGTGYRPVLLPKGAPQPAGRATVEELPAEGESKDTGRTAPTQEAPAAFR